MSNNYSRQINHIIQLGQEQARRHNVLTISSATLLLAILADEKCEANRYLRSFGIDVNALNVTLQAAVMTEEANKVKMTTPENQEITLASDALRIIRLSQLEARFQRQHEATDLHLLRALLRDKVNEGSRILKTYGIDYESLDKVDRNTADITKDREENKTNAEFGFNDNDDDNDKLEPIGATAGGQTYVGAATTKEKSGTPVIDNYGIDLTKAAADGVLDPIVGRHNEMERLAQILSRRKKNNPLIIGEPGVGKSAIVEGLAQMIVSGQVPHMLVDKRIVSLDMASLVAGTQYRGQFEERIRRLIEELKAHHEIILFIDEIHTIIGAGGASGSLDAANMLKPALARGEVQCIGATTINEYKKTIEKDGALERRFQKILLESPSPEETLAILHNIKMRYEDHHCVTYTDDALKACVALSERYITDRSLPDKAIDAMDEAGSRVHLLNVIVPEEIVAKERDVKNLALLKDAAAARQDYETAAQLRDEMNLAEHDLELQKAKWQHELEANRIIVDEDEIASVVSKMSGVPVERVREEESTRLKGMKNALSSKVIAQDRAITRLCRAITRNRLGIKDPDRPIGTFMFVGPTGVGKTHLVKALAEHLFGRKDALIRIDMSEYGEKFSVSRLVGAPPGYVGYEEGGQLTEKVRRHPYSIILLDEIEKAHSDVFNTLLQVMDEGRLTDGNGTTVDFRNTIIVLTSNSGSRQIKEFGSGIGFAASQHELDPDIAEGIVRKALQKQFAPEFLNRLDDIIMFDPLSRESIKDIACIEISSLTRRITTTGHEISLTPAAIDFIAQKGYDPQYGARSLRRTIQEYIEDPICDLMLEGQDFKHLIIDVDKTSEKLSFTNSNQSET